MGRGAGWGLTYEQEKALAFLLWKFLRSRYRGSGDNDTLVTRDSEKAAHLSLRMAKEAGVSQEFLDIMFKLPVLKLFVEELEEWLEVPGEFKGLYNNLKDCYYKPKGRQGLPKKTFEKPREHSPPPGTPSESSSPPPN